ncbi:putative CONSERVED MEMBRANE PROTEIN [Serinicoccus hydrothermalis]|uniref:Putative CONSERVED MEMBRANE PROTEIN n=1 Tax=Serinicoccus hydrothermalis TaxID=1758689 RepID=A0A1B1NGF0_9MICO|nr:RDD family protein [Serinicoccus hydrothermalis]ANS80499.1 putative CONSERVED MEMBRANE PROTEIN [Serinicoccus hydrothermalis]
MATRGIFEAQRFVTSEAVEIELPAAQLPTRMLSGLIDLLLIGVSTFLLVWLLPVEIFAADAALGQAFVIVLLVLVMAGVPITLESLTRGRTVGKMVMGLRTVRDDTGPIGLRHAIIRALAGTFELWMTFGSVALITAMTNEKAKRLGDFLAGTYVVHDRVRLRMLTPPQLAPELADWAAGADIGVLPDSLVVATRQFLARAQTLTPAARAQTGSELYAAVLGHVAPAPPPGVHPELVMGSVLAQRRLRDEERLERADALRARVLGQPS